MTATYLPDNVFARIIRGEIKARILLENSHALSFWDRSPQAPIHVLVVPKGSYLSASHFYSQASFDEITQFCRLMGEVHAHLNLEKGCRWISNEGIHGGQEVPHFHMHLLGGEPLGPLRTRS